MDGLFSGHYIQRPFNNNKKKETTVLAAAAVATAAMYNRDLCYIYHLYIQTAERRSLIYDTEDQIQADNINK